MKFIAEYCTFQHNGIGGFHFKDVTSSLHVCITVFKNNCGNLGWYSLKWLDAKLLKRNFSGDNVTSKPVYSFKSVALLQADSRLGDMHVSMIGV